MPASEQATSQFKITGTGHCAGGRHPEPPLDAYPLLAWSEWYRHAGHDRDSSWVVHLEDGKASVHDVALACAEMASVGAVAAKFGTTAGHVAQAIDYAAACGFLAAN